MALLKYIKENIRLLQIQKNTVSIFKKSSSNTPTTTEALNDEVEVTEDDAAMKEEKKISKLRNVSRLNPNHRNIIYDKMPYPVPMSDHHLTIKYRRRMYGQYGEDSGVNPGIMWPTKEDIEDRKEYERVGYPLTIQEMVQREVSKLEQKEAEIWERQNKIKDNMSKLKKWIADMEVRKKQKLELAIVAKAKKERLMEEVRRHFGYAISDKDEKFQEMLAQKEKAERKALKQQKLKIREELYMKKLMALTAKDENEQEKGVEEKDKNKGDDKQNV